METMDFKQYSDEEFKEALRATLNLKKAPIFNYF